jgi:hypothetical protein
MKTKLTYAIALLLWFSVSIPGFAQTSNASVGGTVSDASGALIPGVTITATNTATGIVSTTVSNEAGAYQFPNLQTGNYKVTAELPGFQVHTYNNVQLGISQQVRLNFTLQVAAQAQNVEVTINADTVLATSSASVGSVLGDQKIRDLPMVVRDVFGLVGYQAGISCQTTNGNTGLDCGNFAGQRLGMTNTTRDGINVSDGRYENGAFSSTYTSPDLVEEVKVIVAPVDAETSRGSGQVQMVTRSGTNQFRGSVFWNNLNSTLSSNTYFNNLSNVPKNFVNRNQYGGRIGGPIKQNKTFFFFLFEGQRYVDKQSFVGVTLTDLARQGTFRFFPGVDNGNALSNNPVVDALGNPVTPRGVNTAIDGGRLQTLNVFGRDPNRLGIDKSAYMQETLKRMPSPNDFTVGDGLNTAGIRFLRVNRGYDEANGNGTNVDRDQYNVRIDHNFNAKNKLSLVGTKEHTWGNAAQAGQRQWPTAYDGLAVKRPDVYTISFVSTLTNSIVNEFRAGRSRTLNWQWGPGDRGDSVGAEARSFLPVINGVTVTPYPTLWGGTSTTPGLNLSPFVTIGQFGRWREGLNPRKSIGDNLSWTTGKHAFKGGWEYRHTESNGFNDPDFSPRAIFGAPAGFAVQNINGTVIPGLTANSQTNAQNLLNDLSASILEIRQSFGVTNAQDLAYKSSPTVPNNRHWWRQSEMSAFFKDDWKFRSNLTLNVGIHWEWYGAPWENDGRAAAPVVPDGKTVFDTLCGISCGTGLTTVQFVGKNSTHEGILSNKNDWNNFAPAVGLSWNLPWWGKDKTVLRAGYGISFAGAARNFIAVDGVLGTVPGVNLGNAGSGISYTPARFTTLSTIGSNGYMPIPFQSELNLSGTALTPIPITSDRTQTISAYDRVAPYTQNINLELQREVARNMTVEIRYIGTKSTKLWNGIPVNYDDIFNTGLLDAFNITRAGSNAQLFDRMLNGINIGGGATTVNGTSETGSMALRQNSTTRAFIANGNVGALANYLYTNSAGTGQPGGLLRRNGFPENFLRLNPQFAGVTLQGNPGNSTYHSLQAQFTKRYSQGFATTTTYTWSRALGENDGDTYRDPRNRSLDKTLLNFHREHALTANASYELPFGPSHLLLANAPGWLSRIVERWQLSGIMNISSGAPLTITAPVSTIYNNTVNNTPDVVGAFGKDTGKVTKVSNGVYYFQGLTQITDPYRSNVTTLDSTQTAFNNKAIQDANGNIVLVNPQPGTLGTLGRAFIEGPKSINFDMNLVKRVRIHESKEFEFRIDAINVLNHTNFGPPQLNINSTANDFGRITTCAATTAGAFGGAPCTRQFVAHARVNF